MILQELNDYYGLLLADEFSDVARPGYSAAKVSFALTLNKDGELLDLLDIRQPDASGKSKKLFAQEMKVPERITKASRIAANFLCENAEYFLGLVAKNPEESAERQFAAFKELHEELLGSIDNTDTSVFLQFLRRWRPEKAAEHSAIVDKLKDLAGANLVVRTLDGKNYLHNLPAIREAWEKHKEANIGKAEAYCLITGEKSPPARLHPLLKDVFGAQSTGAAMVSFNKESFASYGKEQGENAPVSEPAVFAYTTALNYLLGKRREHVIRINDLSIVYWAQCFREKIPPEECFSALFSQESGKNEKEAAVDSAAKNWAGGVLQKIARQEFVEEEFECPCADVKFCVLGLSPNAARISVRFWHVNNFGGFVKNLLRHYQDLSMENPGNIKNEAIVPWRILAETAAAGDRENISPLLAGNLSRAILTNSPYPADLLGRVLSRVRADRNVNYVRAAVLKAYLLRNIKYDREVIKMALNEENNSTSYCLGRLFAVLERTQEAAIGGNAQSGSASFMASAASMPSRVFPHLLAMNSHHLKKLQASGENFDKANAVRFEQTIGAVMDMLPDKFPDILPPPQQGEFFIGYYQQKNALWRKKEKN